MLFISGMSVSQARREVLRTNFWLVPSMEVLAAIALFSATLEVDRAVYHGTLTLPAWVEAGGADTAREILLAVAAAIMTVIGINFSVTIVTLTLASTQFGPRMLRNFIRDRGTQAHAGHVCGDMRVLRAGAVGDRPWRARRIRTALFYNIHLLLVLIDRDMYCCLHHVFIHPSFPS